MWIIGHSRRFSAAFVGAFEVIVAVETSTELRHIRDRDCFQGPGAWRIPNRETQRNPVCQWCVFYDPTIETLKNRWSRRGLSYEICSTLAGWKYGCYFMTWLILWYCYVVNLVSRFLCCISIINFGLFCRYCIHNIYLQAFQDWGCYNILSVWHI